MTTLFVTHPVCRRHEMGRWHPESPYRLDAINDQLTASGLMAHLQEADAPPATRAQLERVHPKQHIDAITAAVPEEGYTALDADTIMNPYSLEAATYAAGAAIHATNQVLAGKAENAFCAVRPPGHHACRDKAMGFCLFNNIAVAARHALEEGKLQRVAVIDFDVHHGNGTEDILANDDRVLMLSFFQHPFYPYSGTDAPAPNMHNTPVPAYTDGERVRQLVTQEWIPQLNAFAPQMIFISAGFDAHREDDLGQMKLVEADYAWMTEQLMQVAKTHSKGRIVSVLEGGYNLSALGRSVAAHVKTLAQL